MFGENSKYLRLLKKKTHFTLSRSSVTFPAFAHVNIQLRKFFKLVPSQSNSLPELCFRLKNRALLLPKIVYYIIK